MNGRIRVQKITAKKRQDQKEIDLDIEYIIQHYGFIDRRHDHETRRMVNANKELNIEPVRTQCTN